MEFPASIRSRRLQLRKAGEDGLGSHETSPGKRRHFCASCGSPIYSRSDAAPDRVYIRVGSLDEGEVVPDVHIHVASRAPWNPILDDLPQRMAEEDLWF